MRHTGNPRRATVGILAMLVAADAGPLDGSSSRIMLERAQPTGKWRATYVLDQPTAYLRFQRAASFYREDVWDVVTPGWSFGREGDEQVLVAETGAETQRLVVEFPVHTKNIPKEYEFFASFTDGSVAIYTGHLYVTPSLAGGGDDDAPFLRQLEMVPPPGAHGVVHGELFEARHIWEDPHGGGTYAYFGRIDPLVTDDMIGIIDPGSPDWIIGRMNEALPEMFAFYTEKFDEPLPWKPVVLFSYDDAEVEGMDSGGGTLTGLVQMSARGRGWLEETPEASEQALYLIAHESAHFWNAQLHPYEEMADSWMHEGSADAMASLVLHEQGVIDDVRLAERRTKALNDCAMGLQGGSLSSSNHRRQFRNYYACGEVLAVWSAAAVPGAEKRDRLFDVWRAVFERSDPEDGRYDRETYFEALASLGVDTVMIDVLRDFVDRQHRDPGSALIDLMSRVGITLERPQRPQREERRAWAAAALRHLMEKACDGRFSFRTEPHRLRTFTIDGCDPFAREMFVVSIEGHPVESAGDLGFRDAAKRCERGEAVTLGLDDGTTVRVPCTVPPTPRPAPLAFPRWR